MTSEKTWFGHPRGLTVLFLTNMWEQFSYYGMRAILVYYMTKQLLLAQDTSSIIYGIYTGLRVFHAADRRIHRGSFPRQETRDHHRRQRDGARAFHDDAGAAVLRGAGDHRDRQWPVPAQPAEPDSGICTSPVIRARAAPTTSTTSA